MTHEIIAGMDSVTDYIHSTQMNRESKNPNQGGIS